MKREDLKGIASQGLETTGAALMTLILGAYDAGYQQGKTDQEEEHGGSTGK